MIDYKLLSDDDLTEIIIAKCRQENGAKAILNIVQKALIEVYRDNPYMFKSGLTKTEIRSRSNELAKQEELEFYKRISEHTYESYREAIYRIWAGNRNCAGWHLDKHRKEIEVLPRVSPV